MKKSRLRELRTNAKKTQVDMAKFLGVTRQGYGSYENEITEPDNNTLLKLADYFDVSTDYLLGRTDNPLTENKMNRVLNTAQINDAETTIHLLEEEARRMGISITDPKFVEMLSNAFKMLRIARGED
jgi:transcriptional regulator with XRE-family HTH domain